MLRAVTLLSAVAAHPAVNAAAPPSPFPASVGARFPFPYDWSKFPTAWFAANATDWESEAQLAEIGKYSMAILGWQHLAAQTHWEAIVYTQVCARACACVCVRAAVAVPSTCPSWP